MKTSSLKIIPGPYRVCSEKHDNGSLVLRSDPKGGGDVPGDLVVALVVGGGPEDYERGTAELLAAAPALRAALSKLVNDLQGLAMAEYGNIESAADYAPSLPEAISLLSNAAGEPPASPSVGQTHENQPSPERSL